jgi:hypothetical protein
MLRRTLGEAREGLLSRRNWPGVTLSSLVVLAGHLVMFVVAARVAGVGASAVTLLPLAVLALAAMGLPLNIGGFGPREGVTAWAFGAAGLGEGSGLSVAVVYGVLSFAASRPGAVVLVARWYAGLRTGPAPDAGTEPAGMDGTGTDGTGSGRSRGPYDSSVSSAKYVPKESARLASSSLPFSAEPRDGRPMTPDSV